MLSVVIPVRNASQLAASCLSSVKSTFDSLRGGPEVQFILIDDCSDPATGILDLLKRFKASIAAPTTIVHFKSRQYYTYACSLGLSLAGGHLMLFISHDMILTPSYVMTMLGAAALDAQFGIIRGCSPHVHCCPQHIIDPPLPIRSYADVCSFSDYVARYHGMSIVEERFLIGDSFLAKRGAIEKIGVMDTRYRHLLGDLDWGLRCRRAGFKIVCAKGAWLFHEGRGHTKSEVAAGTSPQQVSNEGAELVAANYAFFRERWDATLPPAYPGAANIDWDRLAQRPATFDEYVAPLTIDPALCSVY